MFIASFWITGADQISSGIFLKNNPQSSLLYPFFVGEVKMTVRGNHARDPFVVTLYLRD